MNSFKHLSYERSLNPGKAVFYYRTDTSEFEPLQVEVTRQRAPKATYSDGYMSSGAARARETSGLEFSNPIMLETCYVPPLVDILYCRFSLRVISNSLKPNICDNEDVEKVLRDFSETYKSVGGYKELATRYAKNILSAEWLWRNKISREIAVEVATSGFKNYFVKDMQYKEWASSWDGEDLASLEGLASELEESISCEKKYLFVDVKATIKTEFCQEIFPSQLFVDKDEKGSGNPSKQFLKSTMKDGRQSVSFGAYKVGAAIQKIDDWWLDEGAEYPLRVSEYGTDRSRVLAMREPTTEKDFYSLLERVENITKEMQTSGQASSNAHYIMSVLVKGGMFQKGIKKEEK
ncbi:type I-F CRISPR-associated protein Csy3 [Halomonas alkaliantarctica]|nr:type I-F CRISPR-associated protein Csy3 [Halomonas alkaliantarctica]